MTMINPDHKRVGSGHKTTSEQVLMPVTCVVNLGLSDLRNCFTHDASRCCHDSMLTIQGRRILIALILEPELECATDFIV